MNTATLRTPRDDAPMTPIRERDAARKARVIWPDPYPGTEEPALADLMGDDTLRSLMAVDHVSSDSLLRLIQKTRRRLHD